MRTRLVWGKFWIVLVAAALAAATGAAEPGVAAGPKVDLTELASSGEVEPVDGLSTAGQPDAAAFATFAKNGFTTVIDLRSKQEDRGLDEPATVEALGMSYINLPVAGLQAISFENARKLDALIANADGPVLVHCGSANRVGALLALSKSLQGASDDEALDYGKASGLTRLEARVKEVLNEKRLENN